LIPTAVSEHTPSAGLTVRAAYPNPFSGKTGLDVVLSHQSAVTVEVFNVAGQRVRSIDEGSLSAGPSHRVLAGVDDHARELPSGVYFYRVHAGNETVTRKMVITR